MNNMINILILARGRDLLCRRMKFYFYLSSSPAGGDRVLRV